MIADLWQDLRYGARMLMKQPGFAVVAALTLALGIGANTALFSLVNAVLLRQLPFEQPERLVWIWVRVTDRDRGVFSIPDFIDYRDQNQTLEQMTAFTIWGTNLTDQGDPERLQGMRISANAFETLGVEAAFGRTLLPEDDKLGSPRVVVLSYGLWQRRFGADPGLIGKTLTLNGESYAVAGVLPAHFIFPLREAELAIPLAMEADPKRKERGDHFLRVVAQLKSGVSPRQAQAEMDSIAQRLRQQYPETNAKLVGVKVVPLHDEIVGNFRLALLVLLGAVGLVLLIACSNLANLLLARASARHKEIAIRTALGATRGRIVRQLLTESLLLAVAGGGLGLLLAAWGVHLLLALSPADLPRAQEINLDGSVLGFTLAVSILAGMIFGLALALQASKVDLNQELKGASRGSGDGPAGNRVRSLLVISEVALSLVLLASAGLFIKSFQRLQGVNPGFEAKHLLAARLSLPTGRYSRPDAVAGFYERLRPRIERLPGVESVSPVSILPLSGLTPSVEFTSLEHPPSSLAEIPAAQYRMIGPGYFHTMKIPLLQGREFTERDRADAPGVVIINQTLARRFWPGGNPLGSHLKLDDSDGNPPPRAVEIVGVVGDVKHVGLDDEPAPGIYVPYYQIPQARMTWATNNMYWVVRTATDPMTLAAAVRREAAAVDKDVPASSIRSMEQYLAASVAPRRFNLQLLSAFAVAALILAATELYGVISYSVEQRTREIGLRMALGAQGRDVLRLVVREGMRLALIGVAVGLICALIITRLMTSLLFEVSANDPVTFAVIALSLIVVALLACYLPARKATKVDPMIALRGE